MYYYFCQQKYAKNDINHFIYIHLYPFFHHVHCGVCFFISFFSVSPSDSIRHECITLHDDVIALSDSPRFICSPLYDVHSSRESLFVIFAKVKFKLFPFADPLINIFWESIEFSIRFFSVFMNVNTIGVLFDTQNCCETQMSTSCVVLIYFQKH